MPTSRCEEEVRALGDVDLIREAAAATDAEHKMSLWAALKLYPHAVGWSLLLSTAVIMEGYDTVLLSQFFAYAVFNEKFGERQPDGSYQLTAAWQSGLANGALVGEIIGLFLNGIIAERFGYRKTMIGALGFCTAFIFILFFSQTLVQVLLGEICMGIPWGVFQTLTTTYAAEVCPTSLRAYLTTYVNLCWVMGQFIASGVLRAMLDRTDQWSYRIPWALQWMWPIPLMAGIAFAPESPWWLVRKERIPEAKAALARLTSHPRSDGGNDGVHFSLDETVSMMIHTNAIERAAMEGVTYWDLFNGSVTRRRTEIVCAVWASQTLCGATFMTYSTYFYEQAGMATRNAFNMSLAQYAIGFVGTVFSWFLMKHIGRRTLYLHGQILMCSLLLIIGCTAFAGRDNNKAQWAIGSMLLVYTFVYDSTLGPVCYSLVAELSSTRLRQKSVVLARNVYNVVGIATNTLTPRMLNPSAWDWGAKSAFFWAGSCLVCTIWTYYRLPEPKDRTIGELDILFEHKVSARKFSETDPAELAPELAATESRAGKRHALGEDCMTDES